MISCVLSGSSPTMVPRSSGHSDPVSMHTLLSTVPGEPANMANEGTTVSGGRTVLSSILQQSFRTQDCPFEAVRVRKGKRRTGHTMLCVGKSLTMTQLLPM